MILDDKYLVLVLLVSQNDYYYVHYLDISPFPNCESLSILIGFVVTALVICLFWMSNESHYVYPSYARFPHDSPSHPLLSQVVQILQSRV